MTEVPRLPPPPLPPPPPPLAPPPRTDGPSGWRKLIGPIGGLLCYWAIRAVFTNGDEAAALELKPGVCLDGVTAGADGITADEHPAPVSCDEPHDGEIYHVIEDAGVAGGSTTDLDRVKAVDQECLQHFAGYVGVNMSGSSFASAVLEPPVRGSDIACVLVDAQGQITGSRRDWGHAEELPPEKPVSNLAVGDCFMGGELHTTVYALEVLDCATPHDREVFAVLRLPGDDYPAADIERDANRRCLAEFEGYVGRSFEESTLDLAAMSPTASSWAAGDREVVCILVPIPFNESLMGSMRGAAV